MARPTDSPNPTRPRSRTVRELHTLRPTLHKVTHVSTSTAKGPHAHGPHGHPAGAHRRADSDRAQAGQRAQGGALRGPAHPGRRGLPLVRRRLAPRGPRPYRTGPPLRAPDVPGLGTGQGQRPLRAGPGRRGLAQRHHQLRTHQLLRDHARPPGRTGPVAGGRPDGHPPHRAGRGVHGEPARRRQERTPPAVRQRALRHGVRAAGRQDLPRGPPLPPHAHRLDGRPGRRLPGGRAGVLPHLLRAGQRGARGGRRHRLRADPGVDREVLRLHPAARRQAAAARRRPGRHHRHRTARDPARGRALPRADGRLPAAAGRHPGRRRRRPGAHRARRRRVLPAAQPPGTP